MFSFMRTNKVPEQGAANADEAASPKQSLAGRLKQSLSATRERLGKGLTGLLTPGRAVDEELFEELETLLLTCDIGVDATQFLVDATRKHVKRARISEAAGVRDALKSELLQLLAPLEVPLKVDAGHGQTWAECKG